MMNQGKVFSSAPCLGLLQLVSLHSTTQQDQALVPLLNTSCIERKIERQVSSKSTGHASGAHANGIWRSLRFSLYLYTLSQLWGTRFVIIKLVRLDPYTDNFVSLNIHPFCDWGV